MKTFYELLCLLWFKNNQNNFVVYQPNRSKTPKTPRNATTLLLPQNYLQKRPTQNLRENR